ncbi:hypothetical protein [Falsiporphyromonas endometrii]|uniref:Uncharacterized protein n=1 Tax=Falsiporphyromonas endometrii TaxID=1387297 RepID=A0ABV9K5K1_9PORP
MRKFVFLLMLAVVPVLLVGQQRVLRSRVSQFKSESKYVVKSPILETKNIKDSNTVKLTLSPLNADGFIAVEGAVYNENNYYSFGLDEETLERVDTRDDVPIGTYDLYYLFTKNNEYYIVVKENVKIEKDQIVSFDPKDAVLSVNIISLDETGQELKPNTYSDEEDDFGSRRIVKNGNANGLSVTTFLIRKNVGTVVLLPQLLKTESQKSFLHINRLSDQYRLVDTRSMFKKADDTDPVFYFLSYCSKLDESKDIKNDPEKLGRYVQRFTISKEGAKANDRKAHIPGFIHIASYKGEQVMNDHPHFKDIILKKDELTFMIDMQPEEEFDFATMVVPRFGDYSKKILDMGRPIDSFYFTEGVPVLGNADELKTVLRGIVGSSYSLSNDVYIVYPGLDSYSFNVNEYPNLTLGNSCPIMVPEMPTEESEGLIFPYYIGRFGEIMGSSTSFVKTKEEKDGNMIVKTYTDENVLIDNSIEGKNITMLKFDSSKKNVMTPTLQYLQLRSISSGNVTDRFKESNDVRISFSVADVELVQGDEDDNEYYKCNKAKTVKAFVSLKGKDEWKELTVKESPELYLWPSLGYYYSSLLKDSFKDIQLPFGWYDIKFVLEGTNGSEEIQIISPAFKLDSQASIEEKVKSDDLRVLKSGNEIVVEGVVNPGLCLFSADGVVAKTCSSNHLDISGIQSGIYLLRVEFNGSSRIIKLNL